MCRCVCYAEAMAEKRNPGLGLPYGEKKKSDRSEKPAYEVYYVYEQKTWGAEAPHAPRFSRNASDYDLHEKAGGLPLQTITAPNIHPSSKRGREVCKQERKLTSQLKNVGPKGHTTHQAGK